METKQELFTEIEVKFDADSDNSDNMKAKFEGYGAYYKNVDKGYDVLMPGCFKKDLEGKTASDINMYYMHSEWDMIGKYPIIKEENEYLKVHGEIWKDIPRGHQAYRMLKEGQGGLSIGWRPKAGMYEIDKATGIRIVHEAELKEVSIVSNPMNPKAIVTDIKGDMTSARFWEAKLRDEGMSNSNAKLFAIAGVKAVNSRWDVEEALHDVKSGIDFDDPDLLYALKSFNKTLSNTL